MRKYGWPYWFVTVALLLGITGSVLAVDIPPMPPLKAFYTEVPIAQDGASDCLIVVPDGDEYAQLGSTVAAAIRKVSGADVPVKAASEVSADLLNSSNAILLGYFASNPLIERLYDQYHVNLDAKWPGKGGYTIRTVHDPVGRGTSFVCIGGADVHSLSKAVDDFISSLPQQGNISYPHTVRVVLPDGNLAYKPTPDAVQGRIDAARDKNFRACGELLCKAGSNYYCFGNPDELEIFKGILPLFRETVRELGEVHDLRTTVYLFNIWDAIEEASQFSEQERAEISEFMWELTHRFGRFGKQAEATHAPLGNDWDARTTCDMARYWKNYYDLDLGGLYTWAHVRSQSQARFWRSLEDCAGYGGITNYDTLYYVLSYGYDEYWDNGTGRKMADYAAAIINNLGGIAGFGDTSGMGKPYEWPDLLRVAGWKLRDGSYLYAEQNSSGANSRSGNFFHNTYLQDEIKPEKSDAAMGVHVIPLPDWVYEHRTEVLDAWRPGWKEFLDAIPPPPRDQCFDKITFRTSMNSEDQYLIIGGQSWGFHGHPDANAIIEYTDNNRYCLFDSGYFVPQTVEHNTLIVLRDGMFELVPHLAGLAAMSDFDNIGMTRTYLNNYNGANWRRNIVWNKDKYFLVIDEVEALKPGDYGIRAVFRTLSDDKPELGKDRVRASYRSQAFNLVSASQAQLKITNTTPHISYRHSIIESKGAQMAAGDKLYLMNLLYAPGEEDWPYQIVPASENAVMITSPHGYALAGAGQCQLLPHIQIDAAVFYLQQDYFALTAAKTLAADGQIWLAASSPVNISVDIDRTATGTIEVKEDTEITLGTKGYVRLDGARVEVEPAQAGPDTMRFTVPAGRHTLRFRPAATELNIGARHQYTMLARKHEQKLAALGAGTDETKQLQAAWEVDNSRIETRTVYVNDKGEEVENLTKIGTAKCWTEGQRRTRARDAVDGNPNTWAGVYSTHAWARDLPKDMGMEWTGPVIAGCFQIDYADANHGPTIDGQQLQAWDGKDWYPIEAQIQRDESGANWTYRFEPVKTTRIRVFITEFEQGRTAVCEMRIFPEPAAPVHREFRVPFSTNALATTDVDGDGSTEVICVAADSVKCINGDGQVVWEKTLDTEALCVDAYDLDGDGRGEVVVGGADHRLYCFDHQGNELWSVDTPANGYTPDIEPRSGEVKVVGCADIDGDGDGEIVIGCSNWFAYAYDHEGSLVWTANNKYHQPTSIAFIDMGDGSLGSLIGTTYDWANVFDQHGEFLQKINTGYHGGAMCVAAGDMDGDGVVEIVAGSRVGGLHLDKLGGEPQWSKSVGVEITGLAMADLTGDGNLELIAASKNFCVLVTDVHGNILWNCNVGEAILDLAVGDIDGDGRPEIIVGTEGGMVRVLDAEGNITSTFKTGDNVTALALADRNGDGTMQIVAGADDGHVYGDIR